ncbi:hypothetical protein DSN97_05885 [Deferribacteraceae bacterium V6Fe1]|nr:hypothetical protein DSN97_05885 [Deferribacteraceae bacterium V6Fe1]
MDKVGKKKVLLLEPNYKNKYPPIGLMKISTYHRMMGDDIIFHKGNISELIISFVLKNCLNKLKEIAPNIRWYIIKSLIKKYIITHNSKILNEIIEFTQDEKNDGDGTLIEVWLKYFSEYYRGKKYIGDIYFDRIYITTLFTFYWEITVKTINDAKVLVKKLDDIKIGGVMATVLSDDLEKETGIKPHKGLLDKPGVFDNNNIIIDQLPLDYSILDETDYKYPESNAYYAYMTRGCIRKCSFCAVWKIEPKFNSYISLKDKIEAIKEKYGDQRNLLLLDNNVLASKEFPKIIEEIKESGFIIGAKFVEPNYLDIAINNLKKSVNDQAYIKKSFELLQYLLKRLKGQKQQDLYSLLKENDLLNIESATKDSILKIYPEIKDTFNEYRNKTPKTRYVDFNQGVDARLLNEEKMRLLSEIPIRPLRIAFDSLDYKDIYVNAIRLAAKYNIRNLSNYLLYNEKDKPEDLYERIKINVMLAEELNINIYSFPMKYHPISGEKYLNRDYIGEHWSRKYIRAIQTILNATKGKIGTGISFFHKAFGKDINEYNKILLMPETYILHRYFFEEIGFTKKWWDDFNNLTTKQQIKALEVIKANDFSNITKYTKNEIVNNFIREHYSISRDEINNPKSNLYKLKKEYDYQRKKNAHLLLSCVKA